MTRLRRRGRVPGTVAAAVAPVVAGIAACAGGRAPGPQAGPAPSDLRLTYRSDTAAYHAVTHRHVQQEFNGQITATEFVIRYYLRIAIVPGAEGLTVTFVVDSIPVLRGLAPSEADAVVGVRLTTTLSPVGETGEFRGTDAGPDLLRQLAVGWREFFPRLPAGGVREGQVWIDTVDSDAGGRDLELHVRSANRSEAAAWTRWAGQRALHIVTRSDYTVSGSGKQGGHDYELEGTGVTHAHRYLSPSGRYLGLVAADTLRSIATVPVVAATIPITQHSVDSVILLP